MATDVGSAPTRQFSEPEARASSRRELPPVAVDSTPVPRVELPTSLPPPIDRKLAPDTSALTQVFDAYGFPAAPALDHYCMRRLLEPGGERVTLDAFASKQPLARLADFYEKRLTSRGMTRDRQQATWQLPAGSPAPHRVLSILEPTAQGRHRACQESPPQGSRTLLVLTRVD